jgi:N-acetylmuramoyl-L-alanine amidase
MATGEEVVQTAETRIGEKYVMGTLVPKNNSNWQGPWDCAEFASWCVYQVTQRLYGCNDDSGNPASADAYTGYWNRDVNSVGKKISLEEAACTPGALVLRVPQGNLTGHIVISNGAGGTIEAHSSADGVIKSTLNNRRWDTGILIPWVEYRTNGTTPVTQPSIVYRIKSPFMRGPKVVEIQSKLKEEGYDPGIIDGIYGYHAAAAVHSFQIAKGLVPDGEVGSATASVLGLSLV